MTYENALEIALLFLYVGGMIPTYVALEDGTPEGSKESSVLALLLPFWPLTALYVAVLATPKIFTVLKNRRTVEDPDREVKAKLYPIGSALPVIFRFSSSDNPSNNTALVEASGLRFVSVRGDQLYFHKTTLIAANGGIWAPVDGIYVNPKDGQPEIHKRNYQ